MINVMVIDDSAFMRRILKQMLEADNCIKLTTEAINGKDALKKINEDIDVIISDIEMPKMDGLETLKELRKNYKGIPVIMFSSLTKKGSKQTIEALKFGAFDFIEKPSNVFSMEKKEELISKIKDAYKVKGSLNENEKRSQKMLEIDGSKSVILKNIVMIGCSTGGPKALENMLSLFPSNLNAGIIVSQHMPKGDYIKALVESLDRMLELKVNVAKQGEKIQNGNIYICPSGRQMSVNNLGRLQIINAEKESGHAPSVDYMFRETYINAKRYNLIPVVLTGMGNDGSKSSLLLSKKGYKIIVESERTTTVFGMPRKVIESGANYIKKDLLEIPEEILNNLIKK